jgi:hypothetical protein
MVIVDRVTMEADPNLDGYDEDAVLMVSQQNMFMTTILFEKWANDVFFPTIECKRAQASAKGFSETVRPHSGLVGIIPLRSIPREVRRQKRFCDLHVPTQQ